MPKQPDLPSWGYRAGDHPLSELVDIVSGMECPVILLEGTRGLPPEDRPVLVALGALLARSLPRAIFRTGGATGSDDAFAEGVQGVDPCQLEYVLPRPGHRARDRHANSLSHALDTVSAAREEAIAGQTVVASPKYGGLVRLYLDGQRDGALAAKTRYLLRDTLKVTGSPETGLAPAAAGIFYVNSDAPLSGGTGHTIRVCRNLQVPVYVQRHWRHWIAG